MKNFRMILSVMAVVFAVAGAVAGDFLPASQGRYKISSTQCSSVLNTDQDCFRSENTILPLCTITVSGTANQAFDPANTNCTGVLRYNN